MNIFSVISLLGGLAMFLYGMRLMGNSLKESSSGTLKTLLGKVTDNQVKAFILGLCVTAIIQSSTATIVITSGLVAAGLLTLHQSIGIIIGANVGTTVTGQIIRLLDINSSGTSWLQFFKPSTLAPLAMIIGIIFIIGLKFKNSDNIGNIAMGFGILFTGLMGMTGAVESLQDTPFFTSLFANLGVNPFLGYLTGAGVAFVLQSSSATIGILQAFSLSGDLTFRAVYAVIAGVYLGDCVTTAIVCSIGAKAEPKRVGIVNILYNLFKTAVVLIGITICHSLGLLDSIWDMTVKSGGIANTNSIFNLGCAVILFPVVPVCEKMAKKIVKDDPVEENPYADKLDALNPAFFSTPALALNSCHDVLKAMLRAASSNLEKAYSLIYEYNDKILDEINHEEDFIDQMTDKLSFYLVQLSSHITAAADVSVLNYYYKVVSEFERLGDHAVNIGEMSEDLRKRGHEFSKIALNELSVFHTLMDKIIEETSHAFNSRDLDAAAAIEPLEEVVDDMIYTMRERHMERLRDGICNIDEDSCFLNLLTDLERISDICSNVGIETIVLEKPELASHSHEYIAGLHTGADNEFNRQYNDAHKVYFNLLDAIENSMPGAAEAK